MSWTNSHLYEIRAGNVGWGPPDPELGEGPRDAKKAHLVDVLEDAGAKTFKYLYDFGDSWKHTVKVERIADAVPGTAYPVLIDAAGRCPRLCPMMRGVQDVPEADGATRMGDRPGKWLDAARTVVARDAGIVTLIGGPAAGHPIRPLLALPPHGWLIHAGTGSRSLLATSTPVVAAACQRSPAGDYP